MEGAATATVLPESCLNSLEDIQRRNRSQIHRLKLLSKSGNFTDITRKRSRLWNDQFCSICSKGEFSDRDDEGKTAKGLEFEVLSRDIYPVRRLIRSVSTPICWKSGLFCTRGTERSQETVYNESKPNAAGKSDLKGGMDSNEKQRFLYKVLEDSPEIQKRDNKRSSDLDDANATVNSDGSSLVPLLPLAIKCQTTDAASSFQETEKNEMESNQRSMTRANSESISMLLTDLCPSHGITSIVGRRREMEDAVSVVPCFFSLPKWPASVTPAAFQNGLAEFPNTLHFFAVFDGHGGSQASNYCKDRFHELLAEELKKESSSFSRESNNWNRVMSSCFRKMDVAVGGMCPTDTCSILDSQKVMKECCQDLIAPENVGSTAIVAVISSVQIVIANCGDSRAVLSRGGKAIPLSNDHKPNRDDEYNRIEAAGGRVIYWNGHRVGGFLAMSRAIGDRFLKRYVISEPEVTCTERTKDDECLILASDGIWDVLSNEVVCEVARKCLAGYKPHRSKGVKEDTPAGAAAAFLTKLALAKGSGDNISVMVVDLKGRRNRSR